MGFGDQSGPAAGSIRREAAEVYVLAFPLFLMDTVRQTHPMSLSQFHLVGADGARLAPGLFEDDPRIILSSAWIDLSDGPMMVRLPHMHGRHFSLTILDAAGERLLNLGSRTGADRGLDLVLVGPRWTGDVPGGLRAKRSATDCCWAVSRIHAHSMMDRGDAVAVARRQTLCRLDYDVETPAVTDTVLEPFPAPCLRQVLEITPGRFFRRLETLLDRATVLHSEERAALNRVRRSIGNPDEAAWAPETVKELARGFAEGVSAIQAEASDVYSEQGPGWRGLAPAPELGAEPALRRAARAYESLGAPPREDQLTLVCAHDDTGRILSGANAYRIRLTEPAMPPADAFWRLYARPAAGPQYRTGIGSRNDMLLGADGLLDITIQHPLPEATAISNWLPAPEGEMALVMHIHSPRAAALSGAWRLPAVERLDPGYRQRRRVRRSQPPPEGSFSTELLPAERSNP